MSLAAINIKFTADLKGFSTEMQNSIRRIGALGKELQNTGRNLSTYVSLPLVAAGAAAVKFASDYNESLNKVDVAFGPASSSVKEFAKTSLESFGIAEGTALDMAATFGDMATGLGLSTDKASAMSQSLVGLAGDLASFKNISIDIANTALASVFTGETESLKKLGIVMTEANLKAYALSQGINKQFDKMSQAEKVALRYNYILSVTKNSQGDFVRTGGGAANQMRIFQESLKQVGQQLGAVILPAFTRLITFVNGAIKSFSGLSDGTKTTIVAVAGIAAAIGPLLTVLGSMLTFVPNLISKVNQLGTAFGGLTSIIAANPYIALGVAIAAIAGAIYLWYANTKQVVSGQEALNKAIEAGDKSASSEVATLDRLYASSTNVKLGIKERKEAYKSLQDLYPAYFKNIDFENLKNAQSIGIYKELRQAIFDKSRAKAIENELQKRADERVQQELAIRNKIAATEAEILRLKKATTDTVIKGSAAEKTNDIVIKRTDQIVSQTKLLKIQKAELENFTKSALNSDQILLNSKAEYDAKTSKLTENEIQKQKDLIAQNGLQADSVSSLKVGTIAYYESLISLAQKAQKETALNGAEWDALQGKINEYEKKIKNISNAGVKLPKPALPDIAAEGILTPTFSLEELKNQQSYFESLRERFATTSDEYVKLTENINNTKIKIGAIEGQEDLFKSLDEGNTKLQEFTASVRNAIQGAVTGLAEGLAGAVGTALSGGKNLATSFTGLIFSTLGGLLIQLGKIAIETAIAIGAIKASLKTLNPVVAFAAGFAAIAIGTAIQSQVSGLGAFADGGIVGGTSFYGDKVLARVNSGEMIMNQKQQKSLYGLLNNSGGTNITLGAGWELSGDTLRLVLDRNDKKRNRLG